MKRLLAVLAVTCLAVALPAAAQAKVVKSTTYVELSEIGTSDTDSSGGSSQGDILTFTSTQFNHKGGKKIGHGHGYCILGPEPFAVCTNVLKDKKGNSLVTMWEDDNREDAVDTAVVGGTGKYRHARGHAKITRQDEAGTQYVVKARIVY